MAERKTQRRIRRIPEVEGVGEALVEGDDVAAYAAVVVVGGAVLRRRSHLISTALLRFELGEIA